MCQSSPHLSLLFLTREPSGFQIITTCNQADQQVILFSSFLLKGPLLLPGCVFRFLFLCYFHLLRIYPAGSWTSDKIPFHSNGCGVYLVYIFFIPRTLPGGTTKCCCTHTNLLALCILFFTLQLSPTMHTPQRWNKKWHVGEEKARENRDAASPSKSLVNLVNSFP